MVVIGNGHPQGQTSTRTLRGPKQPVKRELHDTLTENSTDPRIFSCIILNYDLTKKSHANL